jgi:hypothetical protein
MSAPKRKSTDDDSAVPIRIHIAATGLDDEHNNKNDNPLVCSFPAGLPAGLVDSSDREPPVFRFVDSSSHKKGSNSKQKEQQQRRVVGKDDVCFYSSASLQIQQKSQCHTQLCVGLYNRRTHQLTLAPAFQHQVIPLYQSVPTYKQNGRDTPLVSQQSSAAVQYQALFADFGSRKKQRALTSRAANRVTATVGDLPESLAAATEATSTTLPTTASADTATDTWRKSFLPPYDDTTDQPHLVYNPKRAVGDTAWQHVSERVETALDQENVAAAIMEQDEKAWCVPLESLLYNLCSDAAAHQFQIKCALFVHAFVAQYQAVADRRTFRLKQSQHPVTDVFAQLFCTSTHNNSFVMSKPNKDKLFLYVLVFYVMAKAGKRMQTSVHDLVVLLQLDAATAGLLLKQAGFSVVAKDLNVALKAPVQFPKLKSGLMIAKKK